MVLTLVTIVYFILYRKAAYKLQNWLDYNDVSQDDFAILVENVPHFLYEKEAKKQDMTYKLELFIKKSIEGKIREWFEELNIYRD